MIGEYLSALNARVFATSMVVCLATGPVHAIGLPKDWEKAIAMIEYLRPPGKTCDKKETTTDRTDKSKPQESDQPDYCTGATGFFMTICGRTLLFSNRHVFRKAEAEQIALFVRLRDKSDELVRLPVGKTWKAHPDVRIDLAASLVSIPTGIQQEDLLIYWFNEDQDRKSEEPTSFLLSLVQLRPGDDILMVGFPSSIPGVGRIFEASDEPLFRAGVVSTTLPGETTIDKEPVKDVILVDSWAFQGNSGSPVFLLPSFFHYRGDDRPGVKRNRPYIIGVVSDFLAWPAETGLRLKQRARKITADTNAGLAIVQSADGIETVAKEFPGAACVEIPTSSGGG